MRKSIKRIKSNKRRKSSRLKKIRSKNKKRLAGGSIQTLSEEQKKHGRIIYN